MNLKSRKEYIETDYVNGVRDAQGKLVIRPLNEKEKQFLNKFYEETINTNFLHDPILKKLNNRKKEIINDDIVRTLKDEVTKLEQNSPIKNKTKIRKLREIIKLTKKQNKEKYSSVIDKIETRMQERREEVLLYPDKEDHKMFYGENNSRNSCTYNKVSTISVDAMSDIEADKNNTFIVDSWEDDLIAELEWDKFEEEIRRLYEVLKNS